MKPVLKFVATCALGLAALGATPAHALSYPIAPAGSFVFLQPWDFLQFSPDCEPCNRPDGVMGPDLERHPGALWFDVGHFIGVFGRAIDFSLDGASLYLWESSGGNETDEFGGPDVQLGTWDGVDFLPRGVVLQAWYRGTGVRQQNGEGRMLFASVTPLANFRIANPDGVNAIRITAGDDSDHHNQVIAVAVTPEPGSIGVTVTALLAAAGWTRRRDKAAWARQIRLPPASRP